MSTTLHHRGGGGTGSSSPDKINNKINGNNKDIIKYDKDKNDHDDDDSLRDSKGKLRDGNLGGGLIGLFVIAIIICWFVLDRLDNVSTQQQQNQNQVQGNNVNKKHHQPSLGGDPPVRKTQQQQVDNDGDGDDDGEGVQYHMLFSTSCSPFQDWQAYMFFHSAYKVGQTGTVTRIASGCNEEQKSNLQKIHKEQIAVLSDKFLVHFTPEFSLDGEHGKTFQQTKYFNKPFGLLHYMENVLGYPTNSKEHDDSIIMIVDPDMMLLKPLTHIFTNYPKHYWRETPMTIVDKVSHGHPIAQAYMYGPKWLTSLGSNVTHVVNEDSPVVSMSNNDAGLYYPAGPPYLATSRDMYQLAVHWVKFLPKIRDVFTGMMAEMHGYSTAAAHLRLPHQLSEKFMISDVGNMKEGWDFLQKLSLDQACQPDLTKLNKEEMPFVLHYCQRYALGRWFSGKYQIPTELFTCGAPLLRVPPRDVAVKHDWFIYPNGKEMKDFATDKKNGEYLVKQNAYAMCTMIDELNAVATHYKQHHCTTDEQDKPNYEKTYVFKHGITDEEFEEFINHPEKKPVDLLSANENSVQF